MLILTYNNKLSLYYPDEDRETCDYEVIDIDIDVKTLIKIFKVKDKKLLEELLQIRYGSYYDMDELKKFLDEKQIKWDRRFSTMGFD